MPKRSGSLARRTGALAPIACWTSWSAICLSCFGRRVCRQHTGAFKAQVALAALREGKTMAQLCQEFDPHANQITEWKRQLLERAADGRGAWRDNVFVERLWRTVKYEHVYKHVYAAWARQNLKLRSTWTGTTWVGHIQVWTIKRPIRLTGKNCLSWPASWQWLRNMKTCGAPRVAYRVGRLNAGNHRCRGQLCTVCNPQSFTYRSGKVVQTNRATSTRSLIICAVTPLAQNGCNAGGLRATETETGLALPRTQAPPPDP